MLTIIPSANNSTKHSFMVIIAFYMLYIISVLNGSYGLNRFIKVEQRDSDVTVMVNQVKVAVPYTAYQTELPVKITKPIDFLYLSTGSTDENLLDYILKLIICVVVELILWKFDFNDPFNPAYLKRVRLLCQLLWVLLIMEGLKTVYANGWCKDAAHGLANYKYGGGTNLEYIIYCWVITHILSFYSRAVKNQKELELTI